MLKSSYKVRTKMILVFSIVFTLSLLTTAVGLWRLKTVAKASEVLMDKPNLKRQLANNWYAVTLASIARTTAIAKSSDGSLAVFFKPDAEASTITAKKAYGTIETLIIDDNEKKAFTEIVTKRVGYVEARDKVSKYKADGKMEEANKYFEEVYIPRSKEYIQMIESFVKYQQNSMDMTAAAIQETYNHGIYWMGLLSLITLISGIILSYIITNSILKQLGGEPDYTANVAKEIALGNLAVNIDTLPNDSSSLLYDMKQMRDNLGKLVSQVRHGTNTIANSSEEISLGNQDLSLRTEHQASSLEETASAMEQLTSTVKQNADNAQLAFGLARDTVESAQQGGSVMQEVISTMSDINMSAKKIVDIISVIDSIAFQTNILALNAAVEAARAGDQGRGFAVVATEVRSLAQRSANAAKEIKGLINNSVEQVQSGVQLVNHAGKTIEEIIVNVHSVSDIVSDIADASKEQSIGIEEVSKSVGQMDQVTQQNASLVEEATLATDSLKIQAQQLLGLVNQFKLEDSLIIKTEIKSNQKRKKVAPPLVPKPVIKSPKNVKRSNDPEDEWEEF